jgi:mono/diheme cytochrome c family protein
MRIALSAVVASVAGLVLATSTASAKETFDPAQIARGKKLYAQICRQCHGADMVNMGGGSFDLRKFPEGQKDRFMTSVTKGKNNMPPHGDVLSQDEIGDLYAYVMGSKP